MDFQLADCVAHGRSLETLDQIGPSEFGSDPEKTGF